MGKFLERCQDRFTRSCSNWSMYLRCRAWKRLETSLRAYELELEGNAKYRRGKNGEIDLEPVKAAIDDARGALVKGDIDGGWKYFQTGQRLEVALLSDEQLTATTIAIEKESAKLSAWRKEAVMALLKSDKPSRSSIVQAMLLRDEHYNNNAYTDGLRRSRFLILAIAFVIAICLLFWSIAAEWFLEAAQSRLPSDSNPLPLSSETEAKLLFSVALIGLLGGIVSAITRLLKEDIPARIPEMTSSIRVIVLRLLIGPASAIIVYLVARSGLYESVVTLRAIDGYTILVVAFVAGFTERLVMRVVETIAGK